MDNIEKNEQIAPESQPAVAEEVVKGDSDGEISLGKFKDVNSLLNAYNSLQAEFTKRCQRLKELEGKVNADKTSVPSVTEVGNDQAEKVLTEKEREEVLKGYLKEVLGSKQKALVMDGSGVGVRTPAGKPKTISEAGILAKEILQN